MGAVLRMLCNFGAVGAGSSRPYQITQLSISRRNVPAGGQAGWGWYTMNVATGVILGGVDERY